MSRNSLLGQSLVRNASALSLGTDGSDPNSKHWKRDWYTPAKPQTPSTVVTPSATPTPFGEPNLQIEQKYSFKIKTWVIEENYTPIVDGDEHDIFDLDQFSTLKSSNGSSDLSDAAIRGAVASDGDSIPGISKSTDEVSSLEKVKEGTDVANIKEEVEDKDIESEQSTESKGDEALLGEDADEKDADGDQIVI